MDYGHHEEHMQHQHDHPKRKSRTRITVFDVEPEHKPKNTCRKCGAYMFAPIALTVHQYSGSGIGYSVALVCINCKTIIDVTDKKG